MECQRCLFTDKEAAISRSGQCEYCDLHDELEIQCLNYDWPAMLTKMQSQNKKYDCLMGISGGYDSSAMLYMAIYKWGLNPLVIHFDNLWNTPEAESNMSVLVKELGVDFIRYSVNKSEYDDICRAFLMAGVPDADIPNDMAMAYFMMKTASDYGIKYILNGHDFRTEGSSPREWSYMDAKYLCSIYGMVPFSFPLLTLWDQIKYALRGITHVRPLYYVDSESVRRELYDLGWRDYGAKHSENIYTEFVGSYLLPRKFWIDKRRTYEGALIRSGRKNKEDINLNFYPEFSDEKIKMIEKRIGMSIDDIMSVRIQYRDKYKKYNFRKYKLFLWVLMKLGLIPLTFYRKYTK